MTNRAPAFQFYTGDWRKDPAVQSLDHEHKGIWIDLLCIMWDSTERGRLVLPDGQPMPDRAIARNLGIPEADWKQTRSTLLSYGVASEDDAGVLYNRRMVRDEAARLKKVEAGRKGGKASKPPSKREAKRGSSSSSSASTSVVRAIKPHASPPVTGGGPPGSTPRSKPQARHEHEGKNPEPNSGDPPAHWKRPYTPEELSRLRDKDRSTVLTIWHLGADPITVGDKPVSMKLEMHIRDELVATRYDPEEFSGGLHYLRQVEEFARDQRVSLRVPEARPEVVTRMIEAWRRDQDGREGDAKPRGPTEPTTLGDVLSEVLEGPSSAMKLAT